MVCQVVSSFKGRKKILDTGYNVLSAAGKGILDAGKWAVDKVKSSGKEVEEKGKPPMHNLENPAYSSDIELKNVKQELPAREDDSKRAFITGKKVEGENSRGVLEERENSANREKGARTH